MCVLIGPGYNYHNILLIVLPLEKDTQNPYQSDCIFIIRLSEEILC